jgi:hypothetical protein
VAVDVFLKGLVGVLQSVVLFFFGSGVGSEFGEALALLEPLAVVEFADPKVDRFEDGVFGPGLSGKAIVGNETPVDGLPGVNCRLEKPLVPVVLELELV